MSELTFEQMLEESFKTIRNGEVVDGTVIDVKPDEIILNIGYKADGIITRNEYTNEANVDLTTVVSVGDQMRRRARQPKSAFPPTQCCMMMPCGNGLPHSMRRKAKPIVPCRKTGFVFISSPR